MSKLQRRSRVCLVGLIAAAACASVPAGPLPTPGAQLGGDAAATLAVAQALGTHAAAQALATREAAAAAAVTQAASGAATREAWWFGMTQTAAAVEVVQTERALTGAALTQLAAMSTDIQAAAVATRSAPLTQVAVQATVASAQIRAETEAARARRQEAWLRFANWLLSAVLLIAAVMGLFLIGLFALKWIRAMELRGLVLETRTGTLLLGYVNRRPEAVVLPRASVINALPLPSAAPQAEAAPAPAAAEPRDPTTELVLALLRDAINYEAANPGWDPERIPGWRELGWSSADQWRKAVKALGDQVMTKPGPGGGTRVAAPYPDVLNLFYAVQSGRARLEAA